MEYLITTYFLSSHWRFISCISKQRFVKNQCYNTLTAKFHYAKNWVLQHRQEMRKFFITILKTSTNTVGITENTDMGIITQIIAIRVPRALDFPIT